MSVFLLPSLSLCLSLSYLCAHVCICIFMLVSVCVSVHVCSCLWISKCACMCAQACEWVCMYVCVCVYKHERWHHIVLRVTFFSHHLSLTVTVLINPSRLASRWAPGLFYFSAFPELGLQVHAVVPGCCFLIRLGTKCLTRGGDERKKTGQAHSTTMLGLLKVLCFLAHQCG